MGSLNEQQKEISSKTCQWNETITAIYKNEIEHNLLRTVVNHFNSLHHFINLFSIHL